MIITDPSPPVGGFSYYLESGQYKPTTVWRTRWRFYITKDSREIMVSRWRYGRQNVTDRAEHAVQLFAATPPGGT